MSNEEIVKGDYVLATKFDDGHVTDHWCVGLYDRQENGRHFVVDLLGEQFRAGGFRRVGKISNKLGNWLVKRAKELEYFGHCPGVGIFSLWDLIKIIKFDEGEQESKR